MKQRQHVDNYKVILSDGTTVGITLTITVDVASGESLTDAIEEGCYEGIADYSRSKLNADQIAEVESYIADHYDSWIESVGEEHDTDPD